MANNASPKLLDYANKLARLREVAAAAQITTLVLRQQGSLSWLFGARSHVPYTLDRTWFDAVIDFSTAEPQVTIVANSIEATRLQDTELADYPLEWKIVGWWQPRPNALPNDETVGSDLPEGKMQDLSSQVASVKRTLTGRQIGQLQVVCQESALIASGLAARLAPTMTETHVAGLIMAELLDRQMDPVTVLVAGGDRVRTHRHPLPTNNCLGNRATLVFCGRRDGLISAVTRVVNFGRLSATEHDRYQRLLEVEADFLDASIAGQTIGEAFTKGILGYAKHGFDPLEWHNHHQGGFSGWESREYPAHQQSADLIEEGAVIAWNPSADGYKVEDTTVITSGGTETLVQDPLWPTITVRGRQRPLIMEL